MVFFESSHYIFLIDFALEVNTWTLSWFDHSSYVQLLGIVIENRALEWRDLSSNLTTIAYLVCDLRHVI